MNHLVSNSLIEMTYFDVYWPFVELLCTSHPTQQQALLNATSAEQRRCLYRKFYIVWKISHISSKELKGKLRPFKQDLADLADRSRSFRTKRKFLFSEEVAF